MLFLKTERKSKLSERFINRSANAGSFVVSLGKGLDFAHRSFSTYAGCCGKGEPQTKPLAGFPSE
ncbi:MAG: hypothetical protein D6691_09100 [Candidatus Hydrogenedentota bacterium]|nr:MAG: hypothetical protein D6691_09100 [Candidatus Hydrogenedentota bacterium]